MPLRQLDHVFRAVHSVTYHGVRDSWFKRESLDPKVRQLERLHHCKRFPGKRLIVQLIENKHSALWNSVEELFDCQLGWLINVEIQLQATDHQMRIILQELVNCLFEWPLNDMNLGKMVEESMVIEDFDRAKKVLVKSRNREPSFS